ncbi:MAG: M23 family metallopeptidase [Steroidobacteraceae bacterium]
MNLIFFSRREGRARHVNLAHPVTLGAVGALALGVLGIAFVLGLELGQRSSKAFSRGDATHWSQVVQTQQAEIAEMKRALQERIDALSMRMGQVNGRMIRIDALGKRLAEMANLDSREFNFDAVPPAGGPEDGEGGVAAQIPDLTNMLDSLEDRVDLRDAQLAALENVLIARQLRDQIHPEGRPVRQGFISSYFGSRQDPFTGHGAFHKGIDFASQAGSDVVAVAAGVVTWSGERSGYGNLVEINHGNGFVTRYGHNSQTLVAVGDTVQRGDTIAQVGSTGRSTGPHVHFEVLRQGRQVDPLTFIGR